MFDDFFQLVALMSLILKHQTSSTELIKFDPLAALFVCNRWDEVKDKRKTADTATSSLGKVWPEFQKSQVLFFSTKNAKRETGVNPGYITDDYIELLNGISRLANIAMERRIKATFR